MRSFRLGSTMSQNVAPTFCKLSAFLYRMQTPEILLRLVLILNVTNVPPLDALRWLIPSTRTMVYSMESLF
jgi:hypothetical protein